MQQVEDDRYMKVEMGGDVIRRRAIASVISHRLGVADIMDITHARPELREGEILCERIGMMPLIIQDKRPDV